MILDAEARARQMREDAEREGRELCRRTEEETLARREEMLTQIRAKTEELLESTLEEGRQEVDALRQEVALRRRIAEKIIQRGLDSKCR